MEDFPKPCIPTSPVLSFSSFSGDKNQHIPSVLDAGSPKFVTSGTIAIALALQQMKIGKNDKVLLPAYHCISMVEPVIQANAIPIFYKIKADTSVDFDDIETQLDSSTKLLFITHYFGFPQDLSKLRNFCDKHNILMLEDCAHAFFGEYEKRSLGSFGDYAIASTMKFFPTSEGGCLVSSHHQIASLHLKSAGVAFEIKSLIDAFEKGFEYGRMGFLNKLMYLPIWLKNIIWGFVKKRLRAEKTDFGTDFSEEEFEIEKAWLDKASSSFSQYLTRNMSQKRIADNRRKNYTILFEALSGLSGCRPLFNRLPEGVIPYVFPLFVDEPEKFFKPLKNHGVPVIRFGEFLWKGMDLNTCLVSASLSKQVFQFPCHQELTPAELDWMINEIKEILTEKNDQKMKQ